MTNRFLRIKHWQLFIFAVGIPILFEVIMMISMVISAFNHAHQGPPSFLPIMIFMPLIMILSIGTIFGWFWSIATKLQEHIPEKLRLNVKQFKFFFFIPVSYMSLIMIIVITTISYASGASHEEPPFFPALLLLIIPLHLFSMFCIFYCLYFVARTIKTAELKRNVSFGDYAGEFFLAWFFFIGIWFLQPKVNRIIGKKSQHEGVLDENLD